ncbi:glutaredoxin-like protein [Bacillus phage vB_BcM_Sam112]|uniref:Glutaredoxin-like protein n=1 Tax=Bacillus phage vB_BcM_Sam112 TaxID=2663324 RepID=A0A5Q2F4L9_9CAUD|nr:glutaredoxin-like protein [Bacillus phage vB_BcM_Sam112]
MKKVITMFTGNDCPRCAAAKVHLENIPAEFKEGVTLIEINVDKVEGARDALINQYKSNTLPTFVLEGHSEPLRGFDEHFGKIQEYIGL